MVDFVPGYTPQYGTGIGTGIGAGPSPAGDPELIKQVHDFLARQAQMRAAGGAASAAPTVTASEPGFGSRMWSALTKPMAIFKTAVPTAAPVTGFGAKALKYGTMGAKFGAPVALAYGAGAAAMDSQENVSNLANSVGADYNSFGGRVGSNVLNFLKKTGDAATFGGASALGRGLANVAGGQSFFEPVAPISTAKPVEGNWGAMGSPQEYSGSNTEPTAGELPPVEPFTAEDIRGNRVPVRGTGAFMNSRGEVTNLDTRASLPTAPISAETLAAQYAPTQYREGPRYEAKTPAGQFAGAVLGAKQIAGDSARKLAERKLAIEEAAVGATLAGHRGTMQLGYDKLIAELSNPARAKNAQEAKNIALRTAASEEWLKTHPGDFQTAGAIAMGRTIPGPTFGESVTSLPDPKTGAITVIRKTGQGAGAVSRVVPQQQVTEANIQGFLKDNPSMTRAQAIAVHRAKGMDVSGL